MDEMELVCSFCFFFTPSPVRTIPSPARTIPSPARTIPFLPDYKFPNKLAPKVPNNIDKNPPFCSLVLFSIVSVTPSNKIPEFSNASIMFIMSFMSSFSIINLVTCFALGFAAVPEPCIFFLNTSINCRHSSS